MKQSFSRRACATAILLILIAASGCRHHHGVGKTLDTFSPDYETQLRTDTSAGKLDLLRWPDFSDYKTYVENFYAMREYRLAWTRDGKPIPTTLDTVKVFQAIDRKGLNPDDYDASRWQTRLDALSKASPEDIARFDVAMTVCTMRLISDLHIGRVNPQRFNFDINSVGKRYDLPTFMAENIVDSSDVAKAFTSAEPDSDQYRATEAALGHYIDLAKANPDWPALPTVTKAIAPGTDYPAAQDLWQRLTIVGDAQGEAPQGNTYSDQIADAIKKFQHRHGLEENGKLGPQTITELNVPLTRRVAQLQDSLERWRWLPDQYLKAPLQVNLPEFVLRAYNPDYKLDWQMRVVVGQVLGQHQTPVFTQQMRYIVLRPYWVVPTDIARKEIVPHVVSDKGYIARKNFEVVDGKGTPVSNWSAETIAHGGVIVREKPGPKNSLGLVKFMFPNQYDIYMHSTPATQLFANSRRDFSHGCIRLQEPEKLAAWVLQDQTQWDADKIHEAMTNGQDNKTIPLKTPIPVVIFYVTALVAEDGDVHFYDDIYKYDQQLEQELSHGYPYPFEKEKIKPKTQPGDTA